MTAQQYPAGSNYRARAVTRLLIAIRKSGKLRYRGQYQYPEEVYLEAVNDTLNYIAKRIDEYDPSPALFMTWVNQKLKFACIDAAKRYTKHWKKENSLEENLQSKDAAPLLSIQVRMIIEEDSDGVFRAKHIKGRPEANFRELALKYASGYTLREIAESLNIPEQTVYSFFSRACRFFREIIENRLKE